MRVRHLVKGLGPGGAERLVVAQVLHGSDEVEPDVTYLLAHKNHLVPEIEAGGVPVTCLRSRRSPAWVWRLRSQLRRDPVDVVHAHSPAVAAVTRLLVRTLPRRTRPAVVGTEHNRWPRHHPVTRLANRLTIRLEQATIAVSDDVRSTIDSRHRDDVAVIIHGIDLEAARQTADRSGVRAELGVADDEVLAVCVANLRREKALDKLVDAAVVATHAAPRLRFALVGQGPLEGELAAHVAANGLGDRFQLLGYRSDAVRVLSAADLFTMSSRHEGLPVAIMEALALGLPVAATAAGGVPDAVGDAGLIVDVDDVAALADAQVRLATDDELRSRLSDAARARAEAYSVTRAVGEIEAIYRTVVHR